MVVAKHFNLFHHYQMNILERDLILSKKKNWIAINSSWKFVEAKRIKADMIPIALRCCKRKFLVGSSNTSISTSFKNVLSFMQRKKRNKIIIKENLHRLPTGVYSALVTDVQTQNSNGRVNIHKKFLFLLLLHFKEKKIILFKSP